PPHRATAVRLPPKCHTAKRPDSQTESTERQDADGHSAKGKQSNCKPAKAQRRNGHPTKSEQQSEGAIAHRDPGFYWFDLPTHSAAHSDVDKRESQQMKTAAVFQAWSGRGNRNGRCGTFITECAPYSPRPHGKKYNRHQIDDAQSDQRAD